MQKLLEHPVISTVIGSLIISIFAWLAGFFPSWSDILAFLTQEITLPIWGVIISGIFLSVSTAVVTSIAKQNQSCVAQVIPLTEVETSENTLSDVEVRALSLLIGLDESLGQVPSYVAESLEIHIEEARLLLKNIAQKGYIKFVFHADNGESAYQLNNRGRTYVIEHGLHHNELA